MTIAAATDAAADAFHEIVDQSRFADRFIFRHVGVADSNAESIRFSYDKPLRFKQRACKEVRMSRGGPGSSLQWWQRCILAAASGVLLTLIFPPFGYSWLAWVALAPLILGLDGAQPATGLFLGWLAGTIQSLGVTGYWMFRAARDYFALSAVGAAAFTVGVNQVFVASYYALFGLAAGLLNRQRSRWLILPTLFVSAEYLRAHLLFGNPWELLGHSQLQPLLMQVCDVTGVYGLSFLLAFTATVVAELRRALLPAGIAVLAVLGVLVYGYWRLGGLSSPSAGAVPVALVQGNLANEQRGRPEFFSAHLEHYLELTRHMSGPPPALIVWPENALGFFPMENPSLVARIGERLGEMHAALLAGAPRGAGHAGVAAIYNSAYLFQVQGIGAFYDKRVLLPFVERFPLRPNDGPFLPGREPTVFGAGNGRFGVLICYEAIYPHLARELVQAGAQWLVNISNDSWFEAGAGPEQHYQMARFRAVENRVSLVRVTNSGVSGVIDPSGRELIRLRERTATAESVTVPIGGAGSFYTHYGDVFALLCIVVSAVGLSTRLLGLFTH